MLGTPIPREILITYLQWVQRRAARVVNENFSREASATEMLRTLNWIPVQEHRARAKVTTVIKALNNIVDIPYNDLSRTTRTPIKFLHPLC